MKVFPFISNTLIILIKTTPEDAPGWTFSFNWYLTMLNGDFLNIKRGPGKDMEPGPSFCLSALGLEGPPLGILGLF